VVWATTIITNVEVGNERNVTTVKHLIDCDSVGDLD
jgi:hypothetical protein